jgi:hypothetical protein
MQKIYHYHWVGKDSFGVPFASIRYCRSVSRRFWPLMRPRTEVLLHADEVEAADGRSPANWGRSA